MSFHPVDQHVGSRLKSRRVMIGMSQDELGRSVGVTFQQIQKYEKGLNRIGCSRLHEISQVLKTSISYFFDDIDNSLEETPPISISIDPTNKEVLLLVRAFTNIKNPTIRKNILNLIKSVSIPDIDETE
jgi:transcriptional regulator with XRE-family HTH domain